MGRLAWATAAMLLVHGALHLLTFRAGTARTVAGLLPGGAEWDVSQALPGTTALLFGVAALTIVVPRWRLTGYAFTAVAAITSLLTFLVAADGFLVQPTWWLPGVLTSTATLAAGIYLSHHGHRRRR